MDHVDFYVEVQTSDFEHDDFAKEALAKTNTELVSERDLVSEYL